LEALAASIGAGAIVGGFLAGLASFAVGRALPESEEEALRGSYLGGLVGLVLLVIDSM
jgi:hypothetical protein